MLAKRFFQAENSFQSEYGIFGPSEICLGKLVAQCRNRTSFPQSLRTIISSTASKKVTTVQNNAKEGMFWAFYS